jgi:hypothetical protein
MERYCKETSVIGFIRYGILPEVENGLPTGGKSFWIREGYCSGIKMG